MNKAMVFKITGIILQIEAILLLLPAVVSLIYRESAVWSYLITAVASALFGTLLRFVTKPKNTLIYAREGLVIVALCWVFMSLFGCLPFIMSRDIPNFFNAFFETVSGFTTTGASVLTGAQLDAMAKGNLFWRSFTHWIGGMGVLVFVTAVIPNMSDRSIHIIKAEMPGPIVGKLVPKVKDTSRVLYLIYILLTFTEIVFLLCGGMPLFDSCLYSFGTAGTGGFSIDSAGITSPYAQWVITVFMLIFGVNFNLYYLILMKRARQALKSEELWFYISMVTVCVIAIFLSIFKALPEFSSVNDTVRHVAFQVSSFVTTTGYTTVNVNAWPAFPKAIMFMLMFTGACAGSTAGGLKLSRVMILFKTIKKEFQRLIHPRSIRTLKFEGKALDTVTRHGVTAYFAIYMICILFIFLIVSFNGFSFETNVTAAVSCFNNIGPAFDAAYVNYDCFNSFTKTILSFAMLLGRLEIYPLLLSFSLRTWSKK